MRKKLIAVSILLITAFSLLYLYQRNEAKSGVMYYADWFISGIPAAGDEYFTDHLMYLDRESDEFLELLQRNQSVIVNFNFSEIEPSMNFELDKAVFEVSWHLSVTFSLINGRWYFTGWNEYESDASEAYQAS